MVFRKAFFFPTKIANNSSHLCPWLSCPVLGCKIILEILDLDLVGAYTCKKNTAHPRGAGEFEKALESLHEKDIPNLYNEVPKTSSILILI